MDWLDQRAAQAKAIKDKEDYIQTNAPGLYESLWEEVLPIIAEANKKKLNSGLPLLTNGTTHSRVVVVPVVPSTVLGASPPKKLQINLAKDRHTITTTGCGVELVFQVDVCDDGVICLKWNDAKIPVGAVAMEMMDRLLFPELPRLQHPHLQPNP